MDAVISETDAVEIFRRWLREQVATGRMGERQFLVNLGPRGAITALKHVDAPARPKRLSPPPQKSA